MKNLKLLLFIPLALVAFFSTHVSAEQDAVDSAYDPELAAALGADEYGMRSYVLVTLVTGEVEIADEQRLSEVFAGHFANMSRLAEEGKLVLAGPLIDARPKRGIFIFNVTTIEEAEKLVQTDPAVKAGVLAYELTSLYSSAALMKINEIHHSIQKTRVE